MIESWKDAPKIHELYEQVCQTSNQIPYAHGTLFKVFSNLSKINLSSNMIIDQTAIHFFDAIYFECQSLKELNLSNNLMTTKSLKAICDIGVKYKNRPSLMVIFIL